MRIKSTDDGATCDIELAGVFVAIGHKPNTELFVGQLDAGQWLSGDPWRPARQRHRHQSARRVRRRRSQDHIYRQAVTSAASRLPGCAGRRTLPRPAGHGAQGGGDGGSAAKGGRSKDALRPLRRACQGDASAYRPTAAPALSRSRCSASCLPMCSHENRQPLSTPFAGPAWPRHSAAQAHANPRPNAHITDSMVIGSSQPPSTPTLCAPACSATPEKLRQGHWPVVAELDLHGLIPLDAQQHLAVLAPRPPALRAVLCG